IFRTEICNAACPTLSGPIADGVGRRCRTGVIGTLDGRRIMPRRAAYQPQEFTTMTYSGRQHGSGMPAMLCMMAVLAVAGAIGSSGALAAPAPLNAPTQSSTALSSLPSFAD